MKVRQVVMVSAIAIALASGPAVAGVAQAAPPPTPSPTPSPPYPIPPWVTEDAHFKTVWDATQEIIQKANRDPEHVSENIGQLLEPLF